MEDITATNRVPSAATAKVPDVMAGAELQPSPWHTQWVTWILKKGKVSISARAANLWKCKKAFRSQKVFRSH